MFDFDAGKLLIIGIVALVFIPSKDLPRVLRQLGQFVTKMRRMASEFQGQFMEAMREADMDELRKEAEKLSEATKATLAFNPISDLKAQVTAALDSKPGLDASEAAALGAASEAAVDQTVPSIAPPDLMARVDSPAHGDSQAHVDAQVHVDPQIHAGSEVHVGVPEHADLSSHGSLHGELVEAAGVSQMTEPGHDAERLTPLETATEADRAEAIRDVSRAG